MGVYSIKDLERITGIKSHTIRIWEQRYQVINPARTDTNIRHYCDNDLRRLLNISILNRNGMKISRIARMSEEELHAEVMGLTLEDNGHDASIDGLVISMVEMCERRFEKILINAIIKHGLEDTLIHIIYPFLNKVGVLWLTGSIIPAQEHFISNLIRQKLITAIDGITTEAEADAESYLLFLPEWEMHEIGLLFYHYLLKKRGFNVIYLGQAVPFADLEDTVIRKKPDYLLTLFTTGEDHEAIQKYINRLGETFGQQSIRINGLKFLDSSVNLPSNVKMLRHPTEFSSENRNLVI